MGFACQLCGVQGWATRLSLEIGSQYQAGGYRGSSPPLPEAPSRTLWPWKTIVFGRSDRSMPGCRPAPSCSITFLKARFAHKVPRRTHVRVGLGRGNPITADTIRKLEILGGTCAQPF